MTVRWSGRYSDAAMMRSERSRKRTESVNQAEVVSIGVGGVDAGAVQARGTMRWKKGRRVRMDSVRACMYVTY
jgi:hypothetical protein